jgi:hypothetical protein
MNPDFGEKDDLARTQPLLQLSIPTRATMLDRRVKVNDLIANANLVLDGDEF